MQPEEIMMRGYSGPKKEGNKFGLVIAMGIMLFIAAIAGVVFGVYELMMRNSDNEQAASKCEAAIEEAKGTGCVATKEVKTITTETAQTIIKPYIKAFNYLNNVFEYGLSDDTKFMIAYQNADPSRVLSKETSAGANLIVPYDVIDASYKKLFKLSTSVAKRDYSISHSSSFTYSETSGSFEVTPFNGGGAGSGMFTVVKNAEYTDDGLTITVYHDVLPSCGAMEKSDEEESEEKYCLDGPDSGDIVETIEKYNVKTLIEKFSSDVPVYQMKFSYFEGHLVLDSINEVK